MPDKTLRDYDLQALVDDELSPEEKNHVLNYLRHDEDANKRYQSLKKQKELLQKWHDQQQKN